jgi:AraC-like DNA-binding protein/mannose-6-phosphate isomerase-like protein (cupin superfamily)
MTRDSVSGHRAGRSAPLVCRLPLASGPGFIEALRATHRGVSFAPHAHAEYALGVALSGSHTLEVGNARYEVRAGDVIVLPPETIHAVESPSRDPWTYAMLYVPVETFAFALGLEDGARWRPRSPGPVVRDRRAAGVLRAACDDLLGGAHIRVPESTLAALAGFGRQRMEPFVAADCPADRDPAVRELLECLRRPESRMPPLRATCAKFHLSVFQLIRRFRVAMDAPPVAFHTQLRARRARDLLLAETRISDVAQRAGYADQSHLNRQFKRVYGMTPGEYARGLRGE